MTVFRTDRELKQAQEHWDKYDALSKEYGVSLDGCNWFLGRDIETWKRLYQDDRHLNQVPLYSWDSVSKHIVYKFHLSMSQGTCIYKHSVIRDLVGVERPS